MNRGATSKRGITLIELVVSIAILFALMALLLPAINSARAASRKMSCSSRMREIGVATAQYETVHRRIPPNLTHEFVQWQFHLLPFIEQNSTHRLIKNSMEVNPDGYPSYGWITIASFLCPEDGEGIFPVRQYVTSILAGKSDYAGVCGVSEEAADGVFPPYGKGIGGAGATGLRYSEITDGLSNTLIYGERPPSDDGTVGTWLRGLTYLNATVGVAETGPFSFGQGSEPMSGCGPQKFRPGRSSDPCSAGHNWSFHVGGGHFATVDAAVTFQSFSIDENVLRSLATRNGGEVSSEP